MLKKQQRGFRFCTVHVNHRWGSYVVGGAGVGLCGGAAAGVSVGAVDGVGVVGEGWRPVGIGEVEDRRGSLGPARERVPTGLESALTFCDEIRTMFVCATSKEM